MVTKLNQNVGRRDIGRIATTTTIKKSMAMRILVAHSTHHLGFPMKITKTIAFMAGKATTIERSIERNTGNTSIVKTGRAMNTGGMEIRIPTTTITITRSFDLGMKITHLKPVLPLTGISGTEVTMAGNRSQESGTLTLSTGRKRDRGDSIQSGENCKKIGLRDTKGTSITTTAMMIELRINQNPPLILETPRASFRPPFLDGNISRPRRGDSEETNGLRDKIGALVITTKIGVRTGPLGRYITMNAHTVHSSTRLMEFSLN